MAGPAVATVQGWDHFALPELLPLQCFAQPMCQSPARELPGPSSWMPYCKTAPSLLPAAFPESCLHLCTGTSHLPAAREQEPCSI